MAKIFNYDLFVDCGSPSLYNFLSRKRSTKNMGASFADRKYDDFSYTETEEYTKYREDYISFLLKNKEKISVYSNLDVINNAKKTYLNQKILEEAGLSPIPVFHLGSDIKYLKKYLRKYPYIAIGGMIPNTTQALAPILDTLFKEYLLDDKGFPRVKLHGFACTSPTLMCRYPWYSVDSTSCKRQAMYGGVVIPNHSDPFHPTSMTFSTRDLPIKNRYSPGIIRHLEKYLEKYNYTKEEAGDSLSKRWVLNIIYYINLIEKEVLPWPWSFYTKKSTGKRRKLNFYIAGAVAKKEEAVLWEGISKIKTEQNIKKRLHSFFYKKEIETLINLKEKEIK